MHLLINTVKELLISGDVNNKIIACQMLKKYPVFIDVTLFTYTPILWVQKRAWGDGDGYGSGHGGGHGKGVSEYHEDESY